MGAEPRIDGLRQTIDEIRLYAHRLGAREMAVRMPTADGEAQIDYRPDDWLVITLIDNENRRFHLPPDWTGP